MNKIVEELEEYSAKENIKKNTLIEKRYVNSYYSYTELSSSSKEEKNLKSLSR